jgi:hypothetical protein
MIRNHLRSHVVGYVALFVALSGTAAPPPPGGADTISTEDIINGSIDTATVQAVFDGGGGNEDPATFSPVATCLAP